MIRGVSLVLAISALTLLPSGAIAQDERYVSGLGSLVCSKLISDLSGKNFLSDQLTLSYGQWTWGYFSGLNASAQIKKDPMRELSILSNARTTASLILEECVLRPSDRVFVAASTVYYRLKVQEIGKDVSP